jgi:hypothetical protein
MGAPQQSQELLAIMKTHHPDTSDSCGEIDTLSFSTPRWAERSTSRRSGKIFQFLFAVAVAGYLALRGSQIIGNYALYQKRRLSAFTDTDPYCSDKCSYQWRYSRYSTCYLQYPGMHSCRLPNPLHFRPQLQIHRSLQRFRSIRLWWLEGAARYAP